VETSLTIEAASCSETQNYLAKCMAEHPRRQYWYEWQI